MGQVHFGQTDDVIISDSELESEPPTESESTTAPHTEEAQTDLERVTQGAEDLRRRQEVAEKELAELRSARSLATARGTRSKARARGGSSCGQLQPPWCQQQCSFARADWSFTERLRTDCLDFNSSPCFRSPFGPSVTFCARLRRLGLAWPPQVAWCALV